MNAKYWIAASMLLCLPAVADESEYKACLKEKRSAGKCVAAEVTFHDLNITLKEKIASLDNSVGAYKQYIESKTAARKSVTATYNAAKKDLARNKEIFDAAKRLVISFNAQLDAERYSRSPNKAEFSKASAEFNLLIAE